MTATQILHRPTFDTRAIIAPLLMALVALGSLYCESSVGVAKGEAFWQLAHKGVASSVSGIASTGINSPSNKALSVGATSIA